MVLTKSTVIMASGCDARIFELGGKAVRMKGYLKGAITLGFILFLGIVLLSPARVAKADETQEVKLNVNSQTIVKGKTFSLYVYNLGEAQTVVFRSSLPAVASVDADGLITANTVGTATITVTVVEAEKTVSELTCDVTVGPPAISVQFSRLELSMIVGQKLTLERIIQPLNTVENAKFSSYDRTIATVSAGGRVTAKAEGSTYIFAQICNGRFAVCKVYIYPEGTNLDELEILDAPAEDILPDELPLEATVDEASEAEPTEESDDFEEAATEIVKDPLLRNTGLDFEAFLKRLNAAGNTADSTENGADVTTN